VKENSIVFQRRQLLQFLVLLAGGVLLAACATSKPIDTSALKLFTQHNNVFSLQVPGAWKQYQKDLPTESMAAFSEPAGHAELIAYAALLDRHLGEAEGQKIVTQLITALLNAPADLSITDLQRQADGTYTAQLKFSRGDQKRAGTATFREEPLALSGVILSGPETGWADFQKAMQPALDSFKVNADFVRGTYFEPLEGERYSMAIPAQWESRKGPGLTKVRSPNGQLQIVAVQRPEAKALTSSELAEQGVKLAQLNLGKGTLTSSEVLPDGRVKVHIEQGADSTIGYLEQRNGLLLGLFFATPANRLADYQALIDFLYSTYVTDLP
jgi:hypothetical protein